MSITMNPNEKILAYEGELHPYTPTFQPGDRVRIDEDDNVNDEAKGKYGFIMNNVFRNIYTVAVPAPLREDIIHEIHARHLTHENK